MKSYFSSKVDQLKPSGIRRFFDLANSLEGVISVGVGEPDFITPWSICDASIQSINRGYTSYTENEGQLELLKEISYYMENRFQVSYSSNTEIIVTVGGSQALDFAIKRFYGLIKVVHTYFVSNLFKIFGFFKNFYPFFF
jgi:aminotransferase